MLRALRALWAGALERGRRVPLAWSAALFLCGLACGYSGWGGGLLAAVPVVGAAVLWGVWRMRRAAWARQAAVAAGLAACALGVGWGRAAWDAAGRRREEAWLAGAEGRVTLECRVGRDVAVTRLRGEAAKHTFRAQDVRVRRSGAGRAVRHLPVEVSWYGAYTGGEAHVPKPGSTWRFSGRVSLRQGRGRLAVATLNSGEGRSEWVCGADAQAWRERLRVLRDQAARRLTVGIEDWGAVAALNQAMLLGSRHEMPAALRRVFADSGTIHVFAISGLHVALVSTVFVLLANVLGVGRQRWFLVVAPLLVLYTVATGSRPSAVRACLMALAMLAAPFAGRRADGVAALSLTVWVVHLVKPHLLFDVGNVLSFVVMAGLVVLCTPFSSLLRRVCGVEGFRARADLYEKAGSGGAARAWRLAGRASVWLADSLAVSLSAWLTSVPLSAYYFGRFTPGGLLANLVVVPCAFLVVVSGVLGMAAGLVSEWAASCFNHAAGTFTWVMIRSAEWTAGWGGFRIEKWTPLLVWGWFAGLAALAVGLRVRRKADGLDWLDGTEEA